MINLTNHRPPKLTFLPLALLAAFPSLAYANAGVPMIFLTFPAMLIALLPIILIESFVINREIAISIKKAIVPCSVANAISTIAGFPLAWGLLLGFELLTTGGSCGPGFETLTSSILTAVLESAWLCPWEDQLYWMIPVAFINCLIVAFFISVFTEYFVMKKMLVGQESATVKKVAYKANIVSYSLLVVLNIVYLGFVIAGKS